MCVHMSPCVHVSTCVRMCIYVRMVSCHYITPVIDQFHRRGVEKVCEYKFYNKLMYFVSLLSYQFLMVLRGHFLEGRRGQETGGSRRGRTLRWSQRSKNTEKVCDKIRSRSFNSCTIPRFVGQGMKMKGGVG